MKIVLLGSIPKGDNLRSEWSDWKVAYIEVIEKIIPDATFVHGDAISDNAGPEMVVGHDLAQIKRADICIVDAQKKIGAGTAQEIVIAKHLKKPVVIVIPKNTHHRRTNIAFHGVTLEDWIHPFLYLSTDYVAESIEDAAYWAVKYAKADPKILVKDLSVFTNAIDDYELSLA